MMSLQKKGLQVNDSKQSNPHKATGLNPNAAEFIPLSLRLSAPQNSNSADATSRLATTQTLGKSVLDRAESSVSNNLDEEAHQYWCQQLPDDITPDFKVTGEDDSRVFGDLSLVGLSLDGDGEASSFPAQAGSGVLLTDHQVLSQQHINGGNLPSKLSISGPRYGEDFPSNFLHSQVENSVGLASIGKNGVPSDSRLGVIVNETDINLLEFLASQFPSFSVESLADLYFTNGCELSLTIEMLTQLESLSTNTLPVPNRDAMDFPALTRSDGHHIAKYADGIHLSNSPYQSAEKDSRLLFKSASTFNKLADQDSGTWKNEKNGSTDIAIGSSRSPHILPGSHTSGQGRGMYDDRLQNRISSRVPSVWLETANLYSDMREAARDQARLRNAYSEQARQAYLVGDKSLAKELSSKSQLHNLHMKGAHGNKAKESIYHQRTPISPDFEGLGIGDRMIDLHGLHVTEALHVLKNELNVVRNVARIAGQRFQVFICVGTGQPRGSRTPVRLPIAVQHYLLEAEGLEYTEPHAGLLRVVIY